MTTQESCRLMDPVVAYVAADNLEAHLIATRLNDAGIPAAVMEDVSNAGVMALGILSNIHNPQVFVSRCNRMQAADILESLKSPASNGEANQFCYHCGAEATASSESCSACGASIERELDSQTEQPESSNLNAVGAMNTFFRQLGKWAASLSILYVAGMLLIGLFGGLYVVVNSFFRR